MLDTYNLYGLMLSPVRSLFILMILFHNYWIFKSTKLKLSQLNLKKLIELVNNRENYIPIQRHLTIYLIDGAVTNFNF